MTTRKMLERSTAVAETLVLLPLVILMIVALVDFGRLVYANQVLVDLTREAAHLVSRGGTADDAFFAATRSAGDLDVLGKGGIIVSEVTRKDADDAQPWIVRQDSRGPAGGRSRVGKPNGPAAIPNLERLDPGLRVVAIEIVHPFTPLLGIRAWGVDPYPAVIYDVAFF